MITNIQEKSDRSFEFISFLNAYIKRLKREIELAQSELTQVTSVNFYTKEIKKKKSKLEADIAYKSNLIAEIKDMQQFPPGCWVKNGSTKPGRVIELRVIGSVPEVQVQWWGSTVPVPERACNLTLVDDYQLEYIWNGDRIPKLIRRLDSYECEDVEIIDLKLNEAAYEQTNVKPSDPEFLEEINRRLAYCKKRIKYLSEPKRDRVSIAAIKRELCTQQRVKLNHETVVEYAEAMKDGDKFPPVKLTYDGTDYWLTDGFHTTEAAWSIGQKFIEAEVTRGTQRDAILASVAVNALHGLRRTNADKRKAVTTLLEDDEWKLWSDREIARRCKVSNTFVSKLRSDLTVNVDSDNLKNYIDKHGNVSQMQTENIGVAVSKDNHEILANNNGELVNQFGKPFNSEDWTNLDSDCPDKESTYVDSTSLCEGGALHAHTVLVSCPDKPERASKERTDVSEGNGESAKRIGNRHLVEQFEIGQLVKLQLANFEGASENLKLANHSYGQITAPTENKCSLNVKVFGHKSFVVSPQDLKPVERVSFCVDFTPKQFIALMSIHQTRGGLEDAIKKGVLG